MCLALSEGGGYMEGIGGAEGVETSIGMYNEKDYFLFKKRN